MRSIISLVVFSCILLALAPAAFAATIDFDDLVTRDNFLNLGIQNNYLGFSWPPLGAPTGWASASTSQRVVGEVVVPVSGNSYAWNWDGPQSLFIDFGQAMDVTGAWFTDLGEGYGSNASTIQMFGYDAALNPTGSTGVLNVSHEFQYLPASLNGIHRLEIQANSSGAWFIVDDITYTPSDLAIPEAGSSLLVGAGLMGVWLAGRRRQQR